MDFGRQVGRESRAQIDRRRHPKNDATKMAKKSQQDAPTTRATSDPGPWGGFRFQGGPNPRGLPSGPLGFAWPGRLERPSRLDLT